MKKIDWAHYVPLGMSVRKVIGALSLLAGIGSVASMRFLTRYSYTRSRLYYYKGSRRVLTGTMMEPFAELIHGVFTTMAIMAAASVPAAMLLYFYHYQGCRSIYTMRRLPNRWELWRRCLTMPALLAVLCGLLTVCLLGIYYLIWRFCTPAVCLPL